MAAAQGFPSGIEGHLGNRQGALFVANASTGAAAPLANHRRRHKARPTGCPCQGDSQTAPQTALGPGLGTAQAAQSCSLPVTATGGALSSGLRVPSRRAARPRAGSGVAPCKRS